MAKKEILFEYNFAQFIENSSEHGFEPDDLIEIEKIIDAVGTEHFRVLNAPGGVVGNRTVFATIWSTNTIPELDGLFREFVSKGQTIYLYFIERRSTKVGDDGSYTKIKVCFGVI